MASDRRKARTGKLDTLDSYMQEIARYPLLTRDQEYEIGVKAFAGDHEAIQLLINSNLRFVVNRATKKQHKGVDLRDLIQAGNEGLMIAAGKYNPHIGTRFVSYASFWIDQAISREIDMSGELVRCSLTQKVKNRSIKKKIREAEAEGRKLSVDDLVKATGYTRARVEEGLAYNPKTLSLDAPADPGDPRSAPLANVFAEDDDFQERELAQEREQTVLRVLTNVLTNRELKVICLWVGIGVSEPWSLEAIGQEIGVCRERARQIRVKALSKLASDPQAASLRDVWSFSKDKPDVERMEPQPMTPEMDEADTVDDTAVVQRDMFAD